MRGRQDVPDRVRSIDHDRRAADRPVRQDAAARGRARRRPGGKDRDPPGRRARAGPPAARAERLAIAPFAKLERAPEHVHTYRVTPLALWNARAAGHHAEQVVDALVRFSRYAVPQPLLVDIVDTMGRYGRLQLTNSPVHGLVMIALDRAVLEEVLRQKKIAPLLGARLDDDTVIVHPSERGHLKQALLKVGWPAEDLAGYVDSEAHAISLVEDDWTLRDYQAAAVEGFWAGGS